MDASGSSTPSVETATSTPSTNTPMTDSSTQNSSPKRSSKRGKSDPAWAHCRLMESTTSKGKLMCMYCQKAFAGGGINRFKQHLAGIKGEMEALASIGPGYKGPNFYDVRGFLLAKNVEATKKFVDSFRETWKSPGCTIMADGWTDQCRSTLINFLVYCPKFIVFLKSVDASDASKTADMLYKLFIEVVLFVGPENVVHMVTDNASNYVAAGRLLEHEFPKLYWSPCTTHCLNLMLHDIGKLNEVGDIVSHASKITKYIYNHCYALHLMRKHTNGREILCPASTRFATNFIALQSILAQKDALRAMVTSREWTLSAYAKDINGRKFVDLVLDSTFWKQCATIVKVTEPLVRVLRIVDSEDRLAIGYMQLHKNLHTAGYWLNPRNQYSSVEMEQNQHTVSGLIDVIEGPFGSPKPDITMDHVTLETLRPSTILSRPSISRLNIQSIWITMNQTAPERYSHGDSDLRSHLTSEIKIFTTAQGDFGRKSAIADRDSMLPGRNYDPISFEDFMETGDWMLEEEPGSLSIDELEDFDQLSSSHIGAQIEDLNLGDILADDDDDANDVEVAIGDRNQSYMDTPLIRSQNLGDEVSPRSNAHGIDTNLSPWPLVNFD
ncbi:putative Zinc finger, BED-type [Corchorus capsularis]|uniref:Putative Zinc finger, BED-type n=1 Tax=Corchorus capsularis TaxID=210143 RepID=A0A1R3JZP8_COCAP|nr:putative Zinc finger, BED-type [Corchorus capsularis]